MWQTALYGNWKNHVLLQQGPEHCQCLKSSFCNRSSLLSVVNYCHEKLHLRCCRHPESVFNDNICQKVIFICWRQPSNLIQQPSHLLKEPSTIVSRKSCFSRGMQVSMIEDDPGLLSISQIDVRYKLTTFTIQRLLPHRAPYQMFAEILNQPLL